MGNSSAKRQKQVNKILEELFEEGLTNEKRTYLVQKIWKLVDPEKSGYLGEKRALLLIKALVRYCNTRALRVLLKSPRRGRWHWLTKSRNKKNSKRSKSINMTITDGMKEFKCSRDEFVIKSKRADSEWNDRVPNRRHRSSELEDFADFRLNNAGEDSDYVQNFLHRIDLDCDGVVTEKEFRIWMTHALDDPVQAVKDVLKKKAPSEIEKQSQATQMHSTNVILKSYRKRRNRTVSTDFDRKFVRSPPSQTKRKQLEEERNFIHDMELFDHSPLTVSTPYGMGQAIDPERDGKLTLHFPWGGTGHFVRKSMKDRMSGSIQLKYENLKLAFTVNEPGALSPPRDQQLMLTLHRQLALEDIDEETIKNLTDDQLKHFLPLLLKRPSNQLKKRLGNNLELLRRAFWRINAAPEYVSGFYIDFVTKKAPKIQKHNTVKFFRDRITSLEAKEKTRFDSLTIFCPLFPSRIVERVDVVKKFSSGHSPFLLSVQFRGLPSLPVQVIYKPDECRADMACLTMFRVFNMCWETSMLKPLQPYAYTFEVWPLGYKSGIIEFIQNAVELQGYDCNKISKLKEEDLSEFLRSAAGSYVACYIMGCRDRHKSNFMIKDDKTFLQIDFKHCFDRQTRGVDAPHFSVMKGMKKALKERGRWNTFKELCQEAFRILRRRNQYLIRICLQIFNGLWFTENEMETWLLKAFRSHETEPQACAAIPKLINEGVSSIQRKLKSWTHKKSLERLRKKTMSVDLKIQTNPLGDFVPKNNVAISPDDERVEYGTEEFIVHVPKTTTKPHGIQTRRSRKDRIPDTHEVSPRVLMRPKPEVEKLIETDWKWGPKSTSYTGKKGSISKIQIRKPNSKSPVHNIQPQPRHSFPVNFPNRTRTTLNLGIRHSQGLLSLPPRKYSASTPSNSAELESPPQVGRVMQHAETDSSLHTTRTLSIRSTHSILSKGLSFDGTRSFSFRARRSQRPSLRRYLQKEASMEYDPGEDDYASNHARKPNSIRSRSRSRLTKITNLPNPRTARTPPPPTTHPRYATLDRFDKITPNYFTKKLNTSSPPVRTPPNPHTSRPTSRAGLRVIEPSHKHSRAKSLGSWPWRSSTPV